MWERILKFFVTGETKSYIGSTKEFIHQSEKIQLLLTENVINIDLVLSHLRILTALANTQGDRNIIDRYCAEVEVEIILLEANKLKESREQSTRKETNV